MPRNDALESHTFNPAQGYVPPDLAQAQFRKSLADSMLQRGLFNPPPMYNNRALGVNLLAQALNQFSASHATSNLADAQQGYIGGQLGVLEKAAGVDPATDETYATIKGMGPNGFQPAIGYLNRAIEARQEQAVSKGKQAGTLEANNAPGPAVPVTGAPEGTPALQTTQSTVGPITERANNPLIDALTKQAGLPIDLYGDQMRASIDTQKNAVNTQNAAAIPLGLPGTALPQPGAPPSIMHVQNPLGGAPQAPMAAPQATVQAVPTAAPMNAPAIAPQAPQPPSQPPAQGVNYTALKAQSEKLGGDRADSITSKANIDSRIGPAKQLIAELKEIAPKTSFGVGIEKQEAIANSLRPELAAANGVFESKAAQLVNQELPALIGALGRGNVFVEKLIAQASSLSLEQNPKAKLEILDSLAQNLDRAQQIANDKFNMLSGGQASAPATAEAAPKRSNWTPNGLVPFGGQ